MDYSSELSAVCWIPPVRCGRPRTCCPFSGSLCATWCYNAFRTANLVAQVIAFMPDRPNNSDTAGTNSLPEYIAHYRILRRLGKGGMGEVFLAEDTKQHGRKVALKVLPHELTTSDCATERQCCCMEILVSSPKLLQPYRFTCATAWNSILRNR